MALPIGYLELFKMHLTSILSCRSDISLLELKDDYALGMVPGTLLMLGAFALGLTFSLKVTLRGWFLTDYIA